MSLSYLAALKVYFLCFNIVRHFTQISYFYCLCDRCQGCKTGFFPNNFRGYFCVCRTKNHYTLERLEKTKRDLFQLEKRYWELLKDLNDIVTVDSTGFFLDTLVNIRTKRLTGRYNELCLFRKCDFFTYLIVNIGNFLFRF